MRCARCFGPEDIRVVEEPTVQPQPGEVLVAVRAVSICPSDHHVYREGHASGAVPDHPMILGHEFSGVVAELGDGAAGPPVGTPVAVEPAWHCGMCDLCLRGLTNICRNVVFPSYPNRDGALAEFIACPAHSLCPVPAGVGFIEAAFAEPLGVAIHAAAHAAITPDDVVAVLGAGAIGVALVELARAAGARSVLVADPRRQRQELPARLGADAVYDSARDIIASVGGTPAGPSVVFDSTNGQGSFEDAVHLCEPAGRVVVITIPPRDECTFTPSVARRKELLVRFSRRSRNTLGAALELIAQGRVRASEWPRAVFSLEDAAEAFRCSVAPPNGVLRAVVTVP